jgi:hypothetical protein
MKTLFTSCYGRAKWFPKGAMQVQTSVGAPPWWQPLRRTLIAEFAPKPWIFAMAKSGKGDWRAAYRQQLEKLHAEGKLAHLVKAIEEGAVLLCHEADHHDCHRKVLADYLNELGLAWVKELDRPGTPEPKKVDPQLPLF